MRYSLLVFFLFANLFLHAQRFKEVIIEADTAYRDVSYGSSVGFKYTGVFKKGKKKELEYRKVDKVIKMEVSHPDVTISGGRIVMPVRTSDKGFVKVNVKFTSLDPDVKVDQTLEIRMNFKGRTIINCKGENGANGSNGADKGTPLLFRDGKTGETGLQGGMGSDAHKVTIRIRKEKDVLFNDREIVFLYVLDEVTTTESIYRCFKPEGGIEINASGGDGGNGGNGGDGGNGKDGNAEKSPGDGGNGGYGGNGGNGGKGGKVTVIAHTNASELLGYLNINNAGGNAGMPGVGGKAGKPGTPATGQSAGKDGTAGGNGNYGSPGTQGEAFELKVEDF